MGVDEIVFALRNIAAASPTGQVVGTTTNDDAAAGKIGEVIRTLVATGDAVSLVTATGKNIASVSLTAGHWRVQGSAYFNFGASTSVTLRQASISQTTNTMDLTAGAFASQANDVAVVLGNTNPNGLILPAVTVKLAATTTVYLVGLGTFTVSTAAAWGLIEATRVR